MNCIGRAPETLLKISEDHESRESYSDVNGRSRILRENLGAKVCVASKNPFVPVS